MNLDDKTLKELQNYKEPAREGETITDPENHERAGTGAEEPSDIPIEDTPSQRDGGVSPAMQQLKSIIDERATYFRVNQIEVWATLSTENGVIHMNTSSNKFSIFLGGLAVENQLNPSDTVLKGVTNWIVFEVLNNPNNRIQQLHYRKGLDSEGNLWILRSVNPVDYIKVTKTSVESQIPTCPIKIVLNDTAEDLPLPLQELSHGDLNIVNEYINLQPQYMPLFHSLLVSFYLLQGEFPIVLPQGQQRTGKSTMIKIMYELADPNSNQLRAMFQDRWSLYTAASNTHLFGLDNISNIPNWFADSICQISTGGTFENRTHFSMTETTAIQLCNPIIIGAITQITNATDVISRSVLLPTNPIDPSNIRTNSEFWDSFKSDKRTIFTGLLKAIGYTLKNQSRTPTDNISRISDFHIVGRTLSGYGLSWKVDFDTAMAGSIEETNEQIVDEHPIAKLLIMHLDGRGVSELEYTATEWGDQLETIHPNLNEDEQRVLFNLVKNNEVRYLGRAFKRLAPALDEIGYSLIRRRIKGTSYWNFKRIEESHATHTTHATQRAEEPTSVGSMSIKSSKNSPDPYDNGLERGDHTGKPWEDKKDNKNA